MKEKYKRYWRERRKLLWYNLTFIFSYIPPCPPPNTTCWYLSFFHCSFMIMFMFSTQSYHYASPLSRVLQQNNRYMYFICFPKIIDISYCTLLVQRINITSTQRIKSIILKKKNPQKNPKQTNKNTSNTLMYDLGFAEINMLLDQEYLWWGLLPISQSKTLKYQE